MAFAYNTSRHETSGMTPFFALYGREAMLPLDVSLGSNPNSTSHAVVIPNVEEIRSRFSNLHEIIKRRMLMAHARQEKRYNRHHTKKYTTLVIRYWFIDLYGKRAEQRNYSFGNMDLLKL